MPLLLLAYGVVVVAVVSDRIPRQKRRLNNVFGPARRPAVHGHDNDASNRKTYTSYGTRGWEPSVIIVCVELRKEHIVRAYGAFRWTYVDKRYSSLGQTSKRPELIENVFFCIREYRERKEFDSYCVRIINVSFIFYCTDYKYIDNKDLRVSTAVDGTQLNNEIT